MTKKLVHTKFHLPYDHQLVERAKELRQNMTVAEKKLWNDYLKTLPLRVLRQRPIAHFIVDFYCAEINRPRRKRTGYGSRSAPEPEDSACSLLSSPQSGGESTRTRLKLVIEVDGESHFIENAQEYDRERTHILEEYGLTVMRFTNQQVLEEFEAVCLQIAGMIPLNPP